MLNAKNQNGNEPIEKEKEPDTLEDIQYRDPDDLSDKGALELFEDTPEYEEFRQRSRSANAAYPRFVLDAAMLSAVVVMCLAHVVFRWHVTRVQSSAVPHV